MISKNPKTQELELKNKLSFNDGIFKIGFGVLISSFFLENFYASVTVVVLAVLAIYLSSKSSHKALKELDEIYDT